MASPKSPQQFFFILHHYFLLRGGGGECQFTQQSGKKFKTITDSTVCTFPEKHNQTGSAVSDIIRHEHMNGQTLLNFVL